MRRLTSSSLAETMRCGVWRVVWPCGRSVIGTSQANCPAADSVTTQASCEAHTACTAPQAPPEAEVLRECGPVVTRGDAVRRSNAGDDDKAVRPTSIAPDAVRVVEQAESARLEWHKLHYLYSQEGPYIGSRMKDADTFATQARRRRQLVRVPQPETPYLPNETSFRRLPRDVILPNEYELRALYPMTTGLPLVKGEADCADLNVLDIDSAPEPMHFAMLAPPGWSAETEYPYMVVLPDHRGMPSDFEDVCANFFERPLHRRLMLEQGWVIVAPVINLRFSLQIPVEGIVARFCDWVTQTYNVEHGKVHLFGKGSGGYTALRTVLEHKDVAQSVTAILGRNGSPFRPLDRVREKIKNYNGVHSLVFVPGWLLKQDYYYKFKFMMDLARIRPAIRNIHFAEVRDHQVYYAINPYEFWNYMRYFRQYSARMVTEGGHALQ